MQTAVSITGLAEFARGLRRMDAALPKALRLAMNEAADLVVAEARPRVPRRSGRAARSIKARSTRTAVRVAAGGKRAPYYPWLDYGGSVGRKRGVRRAFLKEGRYLYPAYFAVRASGDFTAVMTRAITDVARQAGLEVT